MVKRFMSEKNKVYGVVRWRDETTMKTTLDQQVDHRALPRQTFKDPKTIQYFSIWVMDLFSRARDSFKY